MNRSAKGLLIETTTLNGFSLQMTHQIRQTFPLYGISLQPLYYTDSHTDKTHPVDVQEGQAVNNVIDHYMM